MLVLSRRESERLQLRLPDGREVWVSVIEARHGKARLGIEAPKDVIVSRSELLAERK